jgi:CheY-like chemotaxis protein
MVEIDQGQIGQVLLNLFVNAAHAMPDGGNLYIRTEKVTLDCDYLEPHELPPGNYVKTSVTDTGIGMDKTTQQKVFDPFFTTKELERGTGLGLASAYGIIKNHNGFIEVSSKINEGATFSFYLPATEKQAFQEDDREQELLTGTGTVLLVDDEEMILKGTRNMLETLGYHVYTALGGKEAIKIYQTKNDKIDIVILDMIMPVMGGREVRDFLKKINPNVKILLASGYSAEGSAAEIMKCGCEGFIQKPFDLIMLSHKVREIICQP